MRRARRPPPVRLRKILALLPFLCLEFGFEKIGRILRVLRGVEGELGGEPGDAVPEALWRGGAWGAAARRVSEDDLLEYHANITTLSERLRMTAARGRTWKPHQYLALLFAERYFDRYFGDREALLRDLNRFAPGSWNEPTYRDADLRLLAIQSATGSGKTLLMHANILQYRRCLRRTGGRLNNIVLLTPNERMSEQHERELRVSGLHARIFSPDAPKDLFRPVEILDINKLAEKKGVKRVAVSDFGDDNLVLVDEGHLGASGKTWRQRRAELARGGFTIEYSATFDQVTRRDDDLRRAYAKCLLFDYGYHDFHADGYGKDYTISNLPQGMEDANSDMYLLGCLLTFYQQCSLYGKLTGERRPFHLSRPLWVFLGKTVRGSSRVDEEAKSDVLRILDFLGFFLARDEVVTPMLGRLLEGRSGLAHPVGGGDYFAGRFRHLSGQGPAQLYRDICETLFHAAGRLRVVYLATGDGELHLRVGDADPFGVVNVGDSAGLYKLLSGRENPDFDLERNPGFSDRLFHEVDRPDSPVTVVVGARRFIAGWNSWRVSTMGLMHVGVGEGPEIIQMFGRGVRLKGWNLTLKRHRESGGPPPSDAAGLAELETLHIFGLRANYMEAFEQILREEGIAFEPVALPVTWNFAKKTDLKLIRRKRDLDYEQSRERPRLPGPREPLRPKVDLDLYSRLQATESAGASTEASTDAGRKALKSPPTEKNRVFLPDFAGFFRRDRVYATLLDRKRRRGWHNLVIDRGTVDALLEDEDWYDLRIPPAALRKKGFARIRQLEDIAVALLAEYAEVFWRLKRRAWDHERLEVVRLTANDPNHIREYRLSARAGETELVEQVRALAKDVAANDVPGLWTLWYEEHAYRPLLRTDEKCRVTVQPAALDKNEAKVVDRLVGLVGLRRSSVLEGRELFLIRNLTGGRGVSFFDDFHYYPDFIVWLKGEADQHVVFLDPKGLTRFGRRERSKVGLHAQIREVEAKARESDPDLFLHSYVLSVTPPEEIGEEGRSRAEWERDGVYFLDRPDCLQRVIAHALASRGSGNGDGP